MLLHIFLARVVAPDLEPFVFQLFVLGRHGFLFGSFFVLRYDRGGISVIQERHRSDLASLGGSIDLYIVSIPNVLSRIIGALSASRTVEHNGRQCNGNGIYGIVSEIGEAARE